MQEGYLTMTTVETKAEEENTKEPESVTDPEAEAASASASEPSSRLDSPEQEIFFNLLTHVQDGRINDQRCDIQIEHRKSGSGPEKLTKLGDSPSTPPEMDNFMEMLAHLQSQRMDDQRASFNYLPGLQNTDNSASDQPASGATKK